MAGSSVAARSTDTDWPTVDHTRMPRTRGGAGGYTLEPDPVTAPWVVWIFAERARGRTLASLVRELNERGVPCPSSADPTRNSHRTGVRWIVRTLAMILETRATPAGRCGTGTAPKATATVAGWPAEAPAPSSRTREACGRYLTASPTIR
jgi:hypothetical protein